MAVVGSQKIRPVRVVVGVGVRHGLAGDYFAAEVEIRGHAAQVAGRVVVVVELQPVVGGRFRVFLLCQLCTGKHRLLGTKGDASRYSLFKYHSSEFRIPRVDSLKRLIFRKNSLINHTPYQQKSNNCVQ